MREPESPDGGRLFAEDFPVGRCFELGSRALSAEEIKTFAREWDPLPFHVDEQAAAESPLGELVASGVHTLAVFVRLMDDSVFGKTAVIAGRGFREMRLLNPVRPEMRLTGTTTVLEQRLTGPQSATVAMRGELRDDDGETAMTLGFDFAVRSLARDPALS